MKTPNGKRPTKKENKIKQKKAADKEKQKVEQEQF